MSALGTATKTDDGYSLAHGVNPSGAATPHHIDASGNLAVNVASGGSTAILGTPLTGVIGGLVIAGAHGIHKLVGTNASNASAWLMLFDATVAPAAGTVPKAQRYVAFGIATAATVSDLDLGVRQVTVTTGVYLAWSSTPNTFTALASAVGLNAEAYGA